MFEALDLHVEKHVILSDEEKDIFHQRIVPRKLRKRQFLIQQGDTVEYEYFVKSGCLKTYEVDDQGDEHVIQFAIEDWWVSDFKAFYKGERATLNIECLENCELLGLHKDDLEVLFQKVPKFERFFRIKLTNAFVALQERILSSMEKSSTERYTDFRRTYPNIEQRVPNYLIANYLGIQPESLSRLRRKLAKY